MPSCLRTCGTLRAFLLAILGLIILIFFEQARHMVIPYIPMLIPPVKWAGYESFHIVLQLLLYFFFSFTFFFMMHGSFSCF